MEGYEEFTDVPATADLGGLTRLADELAGAEAEAERLEQQLQAAKQRITDLSERQIPEMMDALGMAQFVTKSGFKIDIRRTIRASIPVSSREAAYQWLEDNGHGALIKRNIVVGFSRDQEQEAGALRNDLSERFENVREDRKVEPSTLRAFIGEQLENGVAVPLELFGAWEQRIARITQPK